MKPVISLLLSVPVEWQAKELILYGLKLINYNNISFFLSVSVVQRNLLTKGWMWNLWHVQNVWDFFMVQALLTDNIL